MHRRRFLVAASSLPLAGCFHDGDDPGDVGASDASPRNRSQAPASGEEDGPAQRTLSEEYWRPCSSPAAVATDVDGTDLRLALTPPCGSGGTGRPDLYAHFAPAERGEPPTVRALLHNPGGTPESVERYPFFGSQRATPAEGGGDRNAWFFVPTANHDLVDDAPAYRRGDRGVWRLASPPDDPSAWLPETVTVDPRGSVEGEYAVVLHPDAGPRRTGTYRFDPDGPVDTAVYAWDGTRPGPRAVSRFAERSFPTITRRWLRAAEGRPRDRTMAWHHDAGNDTEVYLEPSAERVTLPARLDFALVNHSDRKVRVSEDTWGLYKFNRGNWYRIAPSPLGLDADGTEPRLVNAGRSTTWTTYLFRGAALDVDGAIGAGHLGGGTYAFDPRVSTERGFQTAVFGVEAGSLDARPDPSLRVRRLGHELVVGRDGEIAVQAERTPDSEFHVIPEQVMAEPALRNTLPHLQRRHEIETVRFVTSRDAVDVATHTGEQLEDVGGTATCSYQGVSYRLSIQRA